MTAEIVPGLELEVTEDPTDAIDWPERVAKALDRASRSWPFGAVEAARILALEVERQRAIIERVRPMAHLISDLESEVRELARERDEAQGKLNQIHFIVGDIYTCAGHIAEMETRS